VRTARKILSTREGTLAFAALAAVLAGGVLMAFISGYKRSVDASAEPVTVLIAKDALPKGSSGDLIAQKGLFQATGLKRDQVKEGAITDPASLRGQVAKHEIVRGQQLTTADFARPTDPVMSKLDANSRAIGVALDTAHGLIGQIHAGDHVDVYAGFLVQPDGASRPRPVMRVLMQDVEVLVAPSADDKSGLGSGGGGQAKNLVLRVDADKAGELAFTSDNGKVWLTLRPQAGADSSPPSLVTLDRMVTGLPPIPLDRVRTELRKEGF
jgi:Flp pilus assembly protein CpaB